MHCLTLSASVAAVKLSAIKNAENVAGKVVKMFKISAKKTAWLKSCFIKDVSSQEKTKRYLVGLCKTWFVSVPVKHSKIGAKNFNKVCPKAVQNALKWPLQYVNFQKIFGGARPGTLWSLFFPSTCFKLILPEKTTLKKIWKFGRLPLP